MTRADPGAVAPALLEWWQVSGRKDLPWQHDPTPYRVWVSEIMLQQTQVATVLRYYDRFLTAFPDVRALAAANQDQVLHLWSGLGYYARARNLHLCAQRVAAEHGGEFPDDIDALVALPGIGRSTAGAVLALAHNRRHAILDGNAKRVLARFFGVEGWPGRSAVARQLWELAEASTPTENAARYTQAIMDLGATLCVRGSPNCAACPLAEACIARATNKVGDIPGKAPRRERPQRQVVVLMVSRADGAVLLERRPTDGIWGGLWGLPETENISQISAWCERYLGCRPSNMEKRPSIQHGFSHFDLAMQPVHVAIDAATAKVMEADRWLWYKLDEPAQVGLAAPVARLLASNGESA
ncbi:MAG: A/G-specific adenine glycosylase [Gammaproteobacteria bacterium]